MIGYKGKEVDNDWKEFREGLVTALSSTLVPQRLTEESSVSALVDTLTAAIQEVTHARVPISKPSPHSKRWWTRS